MASRKYEPLAYYLATVAGDEVTLTLAEIEQVLGAALLAVAWTQRWWLSTRGHGWSYPWVTAGWRARRCGRRRRR